MARHTLINLFVSVAVAFAALMIITAAVNARVASSPAHAATLHYPGCGATIQACINAAAPRDTIFIASGTYTESFTLNKPVNLTGVSAATTIFNAAPNDRVLTVTGSTINNSVVISGLTFANGYRSVANYPNDCYGGIWDGSGGSILIREDARPLLQSIIITGNYAACGGGGLAASSSITLIKVIVSNNHTASGFTSGGGAFISDTVTAVDSTFINNVSGGSGGGLFARQMVLTDSEFIGNSTHGAFDFWDGYGGGAYAWSSAIITGGRFEQNQCVHTFASCQGGALGGHITSINGTRFLSNTDIAVYGSVSSSAPVVIANALFQGNEGGALYVVGGALFVTKTQFINNRGALALRGNGLRIVNSLFANNIAGSVIYNGYGSGPTEIFHTTIVGSTSGADASAVVLTGDAGSVSPVTIKDTIIASYTIGISQTAGQVSEDYNLFFGNETNLSGTITSGGHSAVGNPAFCAPASNNFHLCAGPAALDAGVDAGVRDDIDGNPRPYGLGFDIGYDEHWPLVAADDAYRIAKNRILSVDASEGVLANDTGDHTSHLTVLTWTLPATGALALMADGAFVYTPPLKFIGKVTFTYQASDGLTPSLPAKVSIGVYEPLYLPLIVHNYRPSDIAQLTFDPANDTEPALSPDGQTVVFISDRAGQTDIFSASTTGDPATNLTQTPSAQEDTPVFSPDGAQIAFASNRSGDWDIYLMNADGSNVRRTIGFTGTDELQPFFTPDGASLLFSGNIISGNWDIYSATFDREAASWSRLTTDPAPDRFPSISADGQTIAFRSERDGNSEIYTMNAGGSQVRRITNNPAFDGYPSIVPDGSGVVFTSQRSGVSQLYAINLSGGGLITLTTQSGWTADMPRLSRDSRQLIYATRSMTSTFDVYSHPYDSPLTQIGARGAMSMTGRCDWEAGTLALGLAHAYRATGNIDDLARLRTWINGCLLIKSGHIDQVNDGLLGYAALIAYQADHQPQQLAFAQEVADFLMNTAQRAPDGTLLHLQGQTLIWDDTLLSTVPFLIEMSRISGNSLYLDEAISQKILHAGYLRDPGNGLYHHAAYLTGTLFAPTYWARGNGWALLAEVELLAAMPITHPQRATILTYLQQQAAALKPLQDASGLWPTVVNRPDFYLESSGSALIGYALRRGVRSGWLDAAQFEAAGEAALIGVWTLTAGDGMVGGVSGPTGPMIYEDWYNLIDTGDLELYGQGAALLLASPLSR